MMKCYKIANFVFGVETESKIKDLPLYKCFICDEKPQMTVKVFQCPLPEKKDNYIYSNERYDYYKSGDTEYMYLRYYSNVADDRTFSCRVTENGNITIYISINTELSDSLIFKTLNIKEVLASKKIGIIHSSYIVHNNKAILFCAQKQQGKTTQANIWRNYKNATVVNGDRVALTVENNILYANGIPYSGSSDVSNDISCPVDTIVLLSKGNENIRHNISEKEKFIFLLNKFSYNTFNFENVINITDLCSFIVKNNNVVKLELKADNSAVDFLEEMLWNH